MKKVNKRYVDNLVNKMLNETLEERAQELVSKIKTNVNELGGMEDGHPKFGKVNFSKMSPEEIEDLMNDYVDSDIDSDAELDEGFDDPYIQKARGGKDYSSKEFKRIPKGSKIGMDNLRDDSVTPKKYLGNKIDDIKDILKNRSKDEDDFNFNFNDEDDDLVYEMEKGVCEQCGGEMSENECNECGYMKEGIYDVDDLDDSNEFDYVEEGLLGDEGDDAFDYTDETPNEEACKYHKTNFGINDERTKKFCKGIMTERLRGGQVRLDKNKNNKIDAEDFELLRKSKKEETKESAKPDFLDLDKDGNKKEPMKKAAKDAKKSNVSEKLKAKVKESIRLTEDEMVDLIENIIREEEKLRTIGGKPKGLSKYEQVHDKDGKQNDEYLKSVAAKMKEYLKDGSKGDFEENPKHFPKSNGQISKMKAKKYTMSDDGNEFLNSYMRPGMEDLVPEEIEYDEDWVSDAIEGSSRTGNNPEWANAEETDLGKKINKKRKDKKFHKAKELAYRKAKQPVTDGTGENSGSGLNIKLESDSKEGKILNEEFNKIQHLMSYNRKTQ